MLPIIIAGAVGAIGLAGYKLVRECSCCRERFKWTQNCLCCGDVICGRCGTEMLELTRGGIKFRSSGAACPGSCTDTIKQRDKENIEKYDADQERQRRRLERISKVRLVSVNFGGPHKPTRGEALETDWHIEKHFAEEAARRIAVDVHDADTIWYVKTISEKFPGTSQNGRPYYYRQWKVTGEV